MPDLYDTALQRRNTLQARTTKRRCAGIAKATGKRCNSWAIHGSDLCAGHSGIGVEEASKGRTRAAEKRREARMSVRERAAQALNADFDKVLAALRRGLEDKSAATAAKTAIAYVQLVYGRQLQQKEDERPSTVDPLEVGAMTRAEREAWKARILSEQPDLLALLEDGVA